MGKSKKNKSKGLHRDNQSKNTNRSQLSTASSSTPLSDPQPRQVQSFAKSCTSQNHSHVDRNKFQGQSNVPSYYRTNNRILATPQINQFQADSQPNCSSFLTPTPCYVNNNSPYKGFLLEEAEQKSNLLKSLLQEVCSNREKLEKENEAVKNKLAKLYLENNQLIGKSKIITSENGELRDRAKKLERENRALMDKLSKLSPENSQLKTSNKNMTKMNGELRDRARVTKAIWSGYFIDGQSKDAETLDESVRERVNMTRKMWNDII